MEYLIFSFLSTHHVMKAEKLLLQAGFRHEIIPTPKNISSECGMSIRMKANDYKEAVMQLFEHHQLKPTINIQT
jgi:hypothetical protein